MTETPNQSEIGVLKFLPEPLRFLTAPAIRFNLEQASEIAGPARSELEEIARTVREGNYFHFVEEFLDEYPMTEFEECIKLFGLFGLLDRLNLTFRNYLLSFVTDESGQMVSVHLDLNGANYLIETLEYIRDSLVANDCPHGHLFANDELTSTMLTNQQHESKNVVHVKIYGWNDEWAKKHKLRPY